MSRVDKWSPIRIPDAFRQYASKGDGGDGDGGGKADPMDQWDPEDWSDSDANGWLARIKPSHMGQWMIFGAIVMFVVGTILWLGQFFPLTSGNPWTLVAFGWPASLLVVAVWAREQGFSAVSDLDWTFVTMGRSVRVIPGKFVRRFGMGEIQHVMFTPLKGRSYGAFRWHFLKLGDLDADRDKLMSKATGTNRQPDDDARILLPGPLTGEQPNSVLGRVFGVHGGSVEFHDSGHETDMRVTNPSRLDDEVAGEVLNQLEMYDTRIVPELQSEIKTVEIQKNRYKQRAEAERDPELDRIFGSIDVISNLVNRTGGGRRRTDDDDEAEDIHEQAKEQVNGR